MHRFFLPIFLAMASLALAADPIEFTVGAFRFERPEGWQWIVPTSPMRKAQLNVPGTGGSAEVTFFHFGPGQGGGVQANVDRWFGQFQNAATSRSVEKSGTTEITYVEASGTFLSGMPGTAPTPKEGYALRGAILASDGGDVYVKMTGPQKTVVEAELAFRKMITESAAR